LTGLDGRIDDLEQRRPARTLLVVRAFRSEREPHAAPLDDHVLAALGGIQNRGEALPDLGARVPFHAYIVQLTPRRGLY
jgi:hypothetical protein